MKLTYPDYYPYFKCIADQCGDSCCVGWEIDIDGETAARYQGQPGPFGDRLRGHIEFGDTPHFRLNGERCPFLNDKNLCDVILNLGEGALCEICDQHPRYHEWFGNEKESGVGLCCEAAARLIFEREEPTRLVSVQIDEEPAEEFADEELFRALRLARELLWSLLQDRNRSIWARLAATLRFGCGLQDCLDGEDPAEAVTAFTEACRQDTERLFRDTAADGAEGPTFGQILSFFRTLEPIDEGWPDQLGRIQAELDEVLGARPKFLQAYQPRAYEYEHLAIYFLYRYLLKAVFDGDVLSKIKLMVVSVLLLSVVDTAHWRLTGAFSPEDRVQIAKNYSKEIEYCEENLLRFAEESWEAPCFAPEALLALLNGAEARKAPEDSL